MPIAVECRCGKRLKLKATGECKPTPQEPVPPCQIMGESRSTDHRLSVRWATLMEDSVERLDSLIRSGARRLTGYQRRPFRAEVAVELCSGNARQAERRFGWG